jgi:mono/diheme cytochrome c family protein
MATTKFNVACVAAATALAASIFVSVNAAPGQSPSTTLAKDPGVRAGSADAGAPIAGLTPSQSAFFAAGTTTFEEIDTVAEGLGPRMNLDSCAGCHAFPAAGGSSPAVNPQFTFATTDGADRVPSFIRPNGPVREARFVSNPDGSADGGVHDLFTITGRAGAAGCALAQPTSRRSWQTAT